MDQIFPTDLYCRSYSPAYNGAFNYILKGEDMEEKYTKPSYYANNRKHEPKDIIAEFGLNFNLGNAVKYIARAGKKPGNSVKDDISKAIVYLDFEIENVKKDWGNEYRFANKLDFRVNQSFVDYILDDWEITDDHLQEALKRIFESSSMKFNQEVYLNLSVAKSRLERFLETYNKPEMVSDDPSLDYHNGYTHGWNDAMDDVVEYLAGTVGNPPFYANLDDIKGHCKASKRKE